MGSILSGSEDFVEELTDDRVHSSGVLEVRGMAHFGNPFQAGVGQLIDRRLGAVRFHHEVHLAVDSD
ncbi:MULTISPECIES: hypothetical protein [Halorussus]|uniref:hypothetical protein n=1 Tax=Halorussus TaxID=1070314 RepID=UPI0013B3C01A|nr:MULTISPECIES: hypothetical protein [Halorussus]NHN61576.1 hypothetical protein [Halorussus sp. JP-T4]